MRPMLATRGDAVPPGIEWVHEVKWDGYRVLVEVRSGVVRATSRTERDVTVSFPELAALGALPDGVLDGELVVLQEGRPAIHGVAERFQVQSSSRAADLAARAPATLVVFDLLDCLGESVTARPWAERRQLLEVLPLGDIGVAHLSPLYDDGDALLRAAREQSLEGIVSKRRQSIYRPGARSSDWLKFPLRSRDSFVVGGYRLERGGARIGSLLIGEPRDGGLAYRGRVALAVPARQEREWAKELSSRQMESSPFGEMSEDDARDAVWVTPARVIDVEFLARTPDGRLRHPTYVAQRADLTLDDLL